MKSPRPSPCRVLRSPASARRYGSKMLFCTSPGIGGPSLTTVMLATAAPADSDTRTRLDGPTVLEGVGQQVGEGLSDANRVPPAAMLARGLEGDVAIGV